MSNDPCCGGVAGESRRWSLTMSQRKLSSLQAHGGVAAARAVPEHLGVHLSIIVDDKGQELVAASTHPIA